MGNTTQKRQIAILSAVTMLSVIMITGITASSLFEQKAEALKKSGAKGADGSKGGKASVKKSVGGKGTNGSNGANGGKGADGGSGNTGTSR